MIFVCSRHSPSLPHHSPRCASQAVIHHSG
jgi:hypothetical protein